MSYVSGAVMLPVAALEASINELLLEGVDRNFTSLAGITPERLDLLEALWEDVDGFSILNKYNVALTACSKAPFSKGAEPYQAAACLVELRNALVYFKPEWDDEVGRHQQLEQRLANRFPPCALAAKAIGFMTWFPNRCLGSACAAWSIETVERFVSEFCSRMGIPERLLRL